MNIFERWKLRHDLRALRAQARRAGIDTLLRVGKPEHQKTTLTLEELFKVNERKDKKRLTEIERICSLLVIDEAVRYDVPIPRLEPGSPHWGVNEFAFKLTPEARHELRTKIRDEKRERWELRTKWVPFLAGVTGLVGTAIGLLSMVAR